MTDQLIDILKSGSERWNAWRSETISNNIDLSGSDLNDADLSHADLFRANISEAKLSRANLTGANLSCANLTQTDLSGSDLTHADLSRANMSHTNLGGTDLSGTNLIRADLTQANMSYANMTRADLRGANLIGANLSRANLSGADLTRSFLLSTALVSVDLSSCKGLITCIHRGPSSLSIDTIISSGGKIPEIFLRGCGVPEIFIQYLPSLLANPMEFYSCFISYSHADRSFARRLHDGLQGRGIRCWLDEHQLLPGDNIPDAIDQGIRLYDKVLLCCSKSSLTASSGWWVDAEIEKAFVKERQVQKRRNEKVLVLIPLNLDGALFEWEDGKASQVYSRLAANFTGWEHDNAIFEREFEKVVAALRSDAGGRIPPPDPKIK